MSEWISVKERLPEHGQKVICYGAQWGVNFSYFEFGFDGSPQFTNVRPGCFDNPGVIKWQPLPEPSVLD